jgi:hypothetical protein
MPLSERAHDLSLDIIRDLSKPEDIHPAFRSVACRAVSAKEEGASIILMIGAHVVRSGVQRFLIDLMERGLISVVAMNGAGVIHDYELALIGGTTENVRHYIREGQFGLWKETAEINNIINRADGLGMGEAVGRAIVENRLPHAHLSILAAGYRLNIPVTVHVGIGYDIIHQHPNCDGAATGAASYRDFLTFAHIVQHLEGGVVMNFGSAIMAPEVFLKALSMARNVARQRGKAIRDFTALVCDLEDLPADFANEPAKDNPSYYFRPWKTMLVRTVAEGGQSFYVKGRHAETIPQLWGALVEAEGQAV